MDEMYELFINSFTKNLKRKIKGDVNVCIKDDILLIRITNYGLMFGANLSDITLKIINGFDFEKYVSELTNRYKTFVIHKFMVY